MTVPLSAQECITGPSNVVKSDGQRDKTDGEVMSSLDQSSAELELDQINGEMVPALDQTSGRVELDQAGGQVVSLLEQSCVEVDLDQTCGEVELNQICGEVELDQTCEEVELNQTYAGVTSGPAKTSGGAWAQACAEVPFLGQADRKGAPISAQSLSRPRGWRDDGVETSLAALRAGSRRGRSWKADMWEAAVSSRGIADVATCKLKTSLIAGNPSLQFFEGRSSRE